ncbi:MAG: type II secretion system protein [Candidatus Cloacimonetes bacterium]|nr:type II secretion system protein [Candidatus Cloacimonadota bacterium]
MYLKKTKTKGFNLVEVLITISIFSTLALLMAVLTQQFVMIYLKGKDQADLQTLTSALIQEVSKGDDMYFDGLSSSGEIISASSFELSFVPNYRETSPPAIDSVSNLLRSVDDEAGPPRVNGDTVGGLRIQLNESSQKYEYRYYLSKHPRAGMLAPEVYLKKTQTVRNPETNQDVEIDYPLESTPIRFVYKAPVNESIATSYIIFHGGNTPLEFAGTEAAPPTITQVQENMTSNRAQLFPNPFSQFTEQIIVYYQPEVEPVIIDGAGNQEHLIARLFIKQTNGLQAGTLGFSGQDSAGYEEAGSNNSLILYYDHEFRVLPMMQTLATKNTDATRLQFPVDLAGITNKITPSSFSYYSQKNTSSPIAMTSQGIRKVVNESDLNQITFARLDLLALIGANYDNIQFQEITKRNFTNIIPLDILKYSQAIHTHSSSFNSRLGFSPSNCIGASGTKKCRFVSSNFPSGELITISDTFLISNLVFDSTQAPTMIGELSVIIKNANKAYVTRINFSTSSVQIFLIDGYSGVDPDIATIDPTLNIYTDFPLDNSQFINFSNLQSSGFLDEGYNYTNPQVWQDFLGDGDLELHLELSLDSNIEGFNLTYYPK